MASNRPKDDAERDECITAAATAVAKGGLSAVLAAALDDVTVAAAAYLSARADQKVAETTDSADQKSVDAADAEFDRTFRLWASSVRDADGRAYPRGVASLLDGVLPGDLVRLRPREELTRTANLEEQVRNDASLAGDLARLRDLIVARDRLNEVVVQVEKAEAALTTATKALAEAEKSFDTAWSTAVREMKKARTEIASLVPVFVRAKKAKPKGAAGTVAEEGHLESGAEGADPAADAQANAA